MRLMQGDCLELMADIPDGSVDMVLCDLPYGTTRNKWDAVIPFEPLWAHYKRIVKDNGAIVLFSAEPFTSALIMSNPRMFRYDLIWEKTAAAGHLNSKRMPLRAHENICMFYKRMPLYNPQFSEGKPYTATRRSFSSNYGQQSPTTVTNSDGKRYPRSVVRAQTHTNGSKLHPTQKPVPLLEYLIKTYTNEGETVLDNCMGSGSTGVACVNTGRHFIGIELDPDYFKIAEERIHGAGLHTAAAAR